MKSERRHELEHNALADWLADTLEKIRPYQNVILGGLILVVGLVVAVTLWRNMAHQQATLAWEDYFQALQTGQPGDLEDVADRHPGSEVAPWADTAAADLRLASGCNLLFSDKPSALFEVRKAIDLYLSVLQQTRERTLLERATFGLARAYEAQIDLEKAEQRYQEVVERWPDGPFGGVAKERLAALGQRSVRELADRFAKWEPQPAVSDLPDFPDSPPRFDLDAIPDGPVFTPKSDFGVDGLDDATLPDMPAEPDDVPLDAPSP